MENNIVGKNKKAIKWTATGFVFFAVGVFLLFTINSGAPRGGYCGLRGVDLREWVLWIINLTIFVLSIIFGYKALVNAKKSKSRYTIISNILAVIILIGSILLPSLAIYKLAPFIGACKVREIAVMADIAYLREVAELYAKDNNGIYEGFCDSEKVRKVDEEGVQKNGSKLYCNDNFNEWAACANLKRYRYGYILESAGEYFCSDSIGTAKTIPGKCDENWKYTSCPVE